MEDKCNAIVIRSVNYKDNDKMLTLFSLENGVVSACLRGAKKPTSKYGFAGEMFCFGEYVLIQANGRNTVKEVNQIDSFYNVRLDVDKCFCAYSICEFVNNFMLAGMKSYELFLYIVNSLKILSETQINSKLLLATFYVKALKIAGYELGFGNCFRCNKKLDKRAFFDFESGAGVCLNCASCFDVEIRKSTYDFLTDCSKIDDFSKVQDFVDLQEIYGDNVFVSAIKFLDYFIKQKTGVVIKSHTSFIEDN